MEMNEIRINNRRVACNQALINVPAIQRRFSFHNTWYLSHKQIVFVQMKKLNDAFDEFMIDPVRLVAHYSLSLRPRGMLLMPCHFPHKDLSPPLINGSQTAF